MRPQISHYLCETQAVVCGHPYVDSTVQRIRGVIFLLVLILKDCSESAVGGNFGQTLLLSFRSKQVKKKDEE